MWIVNKVKVLLKDDLIVHSAIVFFGTSLAGVFNLLYHLASVRMLSPQDYGTFNALTSFIMFTTMAISPMLTTLTRFFTEYIAKGDFVSLVFLIRKLLKRLIIVACLVFLVFFIFSPNLARFLKTKVSYIMICGLVNIAALSLPPIMALLQSFQKFLVYSFIGIVSSFGKLVIGVTLMFLGFGVLGGLFGYLASSLVMLMISLFFLPTIKKEIGFIDRNIKHKVDLAPIYKYFVPVSITMLSITFLTTMDVILVKHFFSELDAGYYSIAQMVGKIALFLPSALSIVIFPKITKAHFTDGSSLVFLRKSLIMASICCVILITFSFLFPEFILTILTSKANPVSEKLVGLFALTMSFYALSWIVVHYLMAVHNLKFVLPLLLITIFQYVTIYNCHSSLTMILYILLFFSIAVLSVSLLTIKFKSKKVK